MSPSIWKIQTYEDWLALLSPSEIHENLKQPDGAIKWWKTYGNQAAKPYSYMLAGVRHYFGLLWKVPLWFVLLIIGWRYLVKFDVLSFGIAGVVMMYVAYAILFLPSRLKRRWVNQNYGVNPEIFHEYISSRLMPHVEEYNKSLKVVLVAPHREPEFRDAARRLAYACYVFALRYPLDQPGEYSYRYDLPAEVHEFETEHYGSTAPTAYLPVAEIPLITSSTSPALLLRPTTDSESLRETLLSFTTTWNLKRWQFAVLRVGLVFAFLLIITADKTWKYDPGLFILAGWVALYFELLRLATVHSINANTVIPTENGTFVTLEDFITVYDLEVSSSISYHPDDEPKLPESARRFMEWLPVTEPTVEKKTGK